MFKRIISLTVSAGLLLQQTVFAYTASLNLSNYLSQASNPIVSDRFRPISLRYFSYQPLTNDYKILLDKGDFAKGLSPQGTVPDQERLKETAGELMRYFLIGVTLPNDKFWVNLRPDSEDQIIDDELARTDLGKVMLEADLKLKQDTALFTSPQTPQGKAYWDKLYQRAGELFGTENITIPTLTRPWIVPGEIILRESGDSTGAKGTSQGAYIYKATLKVMLEEDYLKSPQSTVHSPQYNFSDPRLKELNQYSTQLIRELILPKLTQKVNSSKDYANLRQVFFSLILARWFKEKYQGETRNQSTETRENSYIKLIDSRNLTNLSSKQAWDKTTYFQAYQKSFKEGEYNLSEPVYTPTGQVIRRYMSGGASLMVDPTNPGKYMVGEKVANPAIGAGKVFYEGNGLQPSIETMSGSPININSIKNKQVIEEVLGQFLSHIGTRQTIKIAIEHTLYDTNKPELDFRDGLNKFLSGQTSLEDAKKWTYQLWRNLLLYYAIPAKVVLENPAIVHPKTSIPISDVQLIFLLGRYLKMKITKEEVRKKAPLEDLDILVRKVNYSALFVRRKDTISDKDIDKLLADKTIFPDEDIEQKGYYTPKRLKEIKKFLQFLISPEEVMDSKGPTLFKTKVEANYFRKASRITLSYNLPHSIIPVLVDYIRDEEQSEVAIKDMLVKGNILTPGQATIFLNDIVPNASSSLTLKAGVQKYLFGPSSFLPSFQREEAVKIINANLSGETDFPQTIENLKLFFKNSDVISLKANLTAINLAQKYDFSSDIIGKFVTYLVRITHPAFGLKVTEGVTRPTFGLEDTQKKIDELKEIMQESGKNIDVESIIKEGEKLLSASFSEQSVSSSLAQTEKPKVVGGIDFRQMNLLIQPQGSLASSSLDFSLPMLSRAELESFDLDQELTALQRMASSGIDPNPERFKAALAVCFAQERTGQEIDRLKSCLEDVFEHQQLEAKETPNGYIEVLVVADTRSYVLKEGRFAAGKQDTHNLN